MIKYLKINEGDEYKLSTFTIINVKLHGNSFSYRFMFKSFIKQRNKRFMGKDFNEIITDISNVYVLNLRNAIDGKLMPRINFMKFVIDWADLQPTRSTMKLVINEERFLEAIDRAGDQDVC